MSHRAGARQFTTSRFNTLLSVTWTKHSIYRGAAPRIHPFHDHLCREALRPREKRTGSLALSGPVPAEWLRLDYAMAYVNTTCA